MKRWTVEVVVVVVRFEEGVMKITRVWSGWWEWGGEGRHSVGGRMRALLVGWGRKEYEYI